MAKLTDFTTPTGVKGNLFDLSSWTGMILGTVVLFATLGIGQNIARKLDGKGPIDTSVDYPFANVPAPISSDKPTVSFI